MKTIKIFILSVIAFFAGTWMAKAQTNFVVNEIRQYMSKGEQTGFEVYLPTTSPDDARDAFEKWMKKQKAKTTTSKKDPEMFVDNAMIPAVSTNALDMYVTSVPAEKGSKITVFVDLGGAFISSAAYPQQYAAFEAALKKFAKDQAIAAVEQQQKNEEKILNTLQGNLENMVKNKADYIKEIEKAKTLIQQREQDIIKNDADQAAKQQQISLQQQIIETIKQKRATLNY
jgi:predicted HicB family RNase H-like nuclease